jgi:CheY-like chemotaxis protein
MEHSTLTCCYFPTTVAFIDDHETFVENITNTLNLAFNYTPFVNVAAFNNFFAKHPSQLQKNEWIQSIDDTNRYPDYSQHEVSVNFHLIHQQIYNANRYNEISVAVVDYAMPECNGLELCQVIKKNNPHVKTLLLTGEADHQTAVQAFNSNLIDKFILKSSSAGFAEALDKAIFQLAQAYFASTFESVKTNVMGKNALLNDPAFLALFNTIYKKHHACEYYLIDPTGGYLMLNAKGEATWLVVKNEEDFKVCCELAENEDNFDQKSLKLIQEKACIPFYHGDYLNIPMNKNWNNHLLTAEKLNLNGTLYSYAEYSGFQHSIIDKSKVRSFDEYKTHEK